MCSNGLGGSGNIILIVIVVVLLIALFKQYGHYLKKFNFSWASEQFDKTGFFSDFTKTPEGMDEEEEVELSDPKNDHEEEYDPRN